MASQLVLLTALAGILGPAITNSFALAKLTAGCSTNSFATPSWLVHDYSSTSSSASFRVLSRATNTSADLLCQIGSSNTSTSCVTGAESGLLASVRLNGTNALVLLNQTWACNDVKPLTFAAVGSGSLVLSCAGGTCKSATMAPLLIKGSLLSPINITPIYANGPTGHTSQGCSSLSKMPWWELTASQVARRTTYSGDIATSSGNAFIQITNHITGSSTSCLINSFSRQPGPQAMDCQEQGPYRPREKFHIKTEAFFDQSNFTLTVNETWYCDEIDPAAPTVFTATSTVHLPLECQDFPIENSRDLVVFCTGPEENPVWNGTIVAQDTLPPYSLGDPLPTADSCTVSSILSPAWRMGNLAANTDTSERSGSLTLQIELATSEIPGQYPTTIIQSWQLLGETSEGQAEWYTCGFPDGEQPEHLTGCTFQYSAASKTLALNATWTCRDLDRERPIFFTGIANGTIPDLTCTPVAGSNDTRCATTRGVAWTTDIKLVSWHQ